MKGLLAHAFFLMMGSVEPFSPADGTIWPLATFYRDGAAA
jgi:hypothetical protein